jgi:1-acyl-sn-glycerol-3-phosphate acyltransferase
MNALSPSLPSVDPRERSWWVCCRICQGLFGAIARIEHVGPRALPEGPLLIAGNHISHFDPPIVGSRFNRKVDFMAMEPLFRRPWARHLLAEWMDAFPVRRGRPDLGAIREAVRRLKAGRVVYVFPEGGLRTGETSVLGGAPLPPGAAMLAQMADAPVLPCVIFGSDQLYVWQNLFRRPRVWVGVGDLLRLRADLPPEEAREDLNQRIAASWRALHAAFRAHPGYHPGLEPRTAQQRWKDGR